MPLAGHYALARYEDTREPELVSLDTMRENHHKTASIPPGDRRTRVEQLAQSREAAFHPSPHE